MEKTKNNMNKKVARMFRNIATAALLSTFTFVANEGTAQNTKNNDANNIKTSQTINKISLSEYQSLLDKRNQIMKNKYKDYDTIELLESTQKEVFLRSYNNNDNLVKTNINDLQKILNEKFGMKLDRNAVEILNYSLIELGKSNKIDGLNNFTNKINPKTFDINTINAIGLLEANYPELWKKSEGELMPTWNTTNLGLLAKLVNLLEKVEKTANFRRIAENEERIAENEERMTENGTENVREYEKVKNNVIYLDGGEINLDEERIAENEGRMTENGAENGGEYEEVKNKKVLEEKNPVVDEKTKKIEKPVDTKKPKEQTPSKESEKNNVIDLDGGEINLDEERIAENEERMTENGTENVREYEKVKNKKVLEEKNPVVDEKTKKIEKPVDTKKPEVEQKKSENNNVIDLDGGEINLDEEPDEEVDAVDIGANLGKEDEVNFIHYDFEKELNQDLDYAIQKHRINELRNEYPVVKKFVNSLKEVGVDFDKGDDTNINRTSATLRTINGDFAFGREAVENAKVSEKYGAEAVKSIIFQNWAKEITVGDNLEIVKNMSWNKNILEQKLTKDKLNNVSFEEILNVVESFGDDELKKAFMYNLLNNDIVSAQKIMGMDINCDSRYADYKAGNKLGRVELEKIKNLGKYRKYMEQKDILENKNIPQDIKNTYSDFVSGKINNKGREYSILSKTDFKIYLFSANHHLLSRQNILVGSNVGDHANNPMKGVRTTPGGLYEVGNSFEKASSGDDFFEKYGTHYIVLIPIEQQYTPSDQYTMGLHGTYEKDQSRDRKINSQNSRDRRATNGCVNIIDETFGEIFNHVKLGTMFFVTREPSSKDIEKFLENKK